MKTEKVRILTKTDKHIAAVIHYPGNDSNRLAILCPGNLDSKDYDHLVKLAEALAKIGYTAIRFDPLGTWESDGTEANYLTSQYLDDVESVLRYMTEKKAFDHILLGGHSRGGMISILYAAKDPRISVVVPIMPPTPLTEEELKGEKYIRWKKNGFNLSRRDIPGSSEMKEYKLPYAHLLDRIQFNVIGAVRKIHAPIIIVAGELDNICLPEDVREIFDNANEPKKYLLIKGVGHDYRHDLSEIDLVNREIMEALKTFS